MEKIINLKFKASNVDKIESAKGAPIENVLSDTTINNIAFIVSNAFINEDGKIGIPKAQAMDKIDQHLEHYDKEDLMLDITEALVNAGFLSRELDTQAIRDQKAKAIKEANEQIKNM